ncbi:MAG: AAA family ATPase [Chloroflexales bacterium]
MLAATTTVIQLLGDGLIGALTGRVVDEAERLIRGEPARNALKEALIQAITRYVAESSNNLARPLLDPQGFLTSKAIIDEIAIVLLFDETRSPNYEQIGAAWRQSLSDPPAWVNFSDEARKLVDLIEAELQRSEVFGSAIARKDLREIAGDTAASAEILVAIERHVAVIRHILAPQPPTDIRAHIRDFSQLIAEKTEDFVGRSFVFDAFQRFVAHAPCGYFVIRGDPGIGKSALAAELVRLSDYAHHFNIRAESNNTTGHFMRHICAQLIATYNLPWVSLPDNIAHDSEFLKTILAAVSAQLKAGERAVLIVDALDEVNHTNLQPGANTLLLPKSLPRNVYVFATSRRDDLTVHLAANCDIQILDIDQNSAENQADIKAYVTTRASRPGIQRYIAAQEIDSELFVAHLREKSQGNFMYLRYILPEIERGMYRDLSLAALPSGLQNFYKDHWAYIRQATDGQRWVNETIPVIAAITVTPRPVSVDLLSSYSGGVDRSRIMQVLDEFDQFLYKEPITYDTGPRSCYRFYHASFHDFIAGLDLIAEERIKLTAARKRITDGLLDDIGL